MGIDSDALFEEDIFPASVEVTLKPEFVDPAKIDGVVNQLKAIDGVKDVVNDNQLTIDVYNNLNRILTWILAFSILFLIVAMVLINNSIRLKIFSKRFIIKTMQLVGAKRRFILMPFIREALVLGLIGAFHRDFGFGWRLVLFYKPDRDTFCSGHRSICDIVVYNFTGRYYYNRCKYYLCNLEILTQQRR